MNRKKLSTWEAACIVTGYGVGGGVMSMPYLADKAGLISATVMLVITLAASFVLHLMIADISLKMDDNSGGQIISCLDRFLFRGPLKKFMTVLFFVLMTLILFTNLAAYITGAEELLVELIPVSNFTAKIIFYVCAASVVLLGLKAVGISEGITVPVIFALILVLAVPSIGKGNNSINFTNGSISGCLAFYGMAMYAMSAFFSVPQVVEGLEKDKAKIKKALFLGFFNNFILIIVVVICSLAASKPVTELAMVGWSAGIGSWAQVVGGLFTVLAMITTYWSLSLALGSIVQEQFKWNYKLCWVVATVPSLILALFNFASFMEFMRLAGGLISIIIAVMVVPAYVNASKEIPGGMLGKFESRATEILIIIAYILMGVGSVIPV